jgi:lipopolysaccharide export system permease protein
MKTLDRYLLGEMLGVFAIGLVAFTAVLLTNRILRLAELIVVKGVDLPTVAAMLAYILPAFLAVTIPMAVMLAALATYGRLAADGEILALKAAGISLHRLMVPALVLGLAGYAATMAITAYAQPWGMRAFKDLLFQIARARAAVGLRAGVFLGEFEGFILYVRALDERSALAREIFLVDARDPASPRVVLAREGRLRADPGGERLLFELADGSLHVSSATDPGRYRRATFAGYRLALPIGRGLVDPAERRRGDAEMGFGELRERVRSLRARGEPYAPFLVELHKKLAIPTACLIFVLAGPALGLRARKAGRAGSLALSVGLAVGYYALLAAGEGLGDRGELAAVVGVWTPNALLLALGGLLWFTGAREITLRELLRDLGRPFRRRSDPASRPTHQRPPPDT